MCCFIFRHFISVAPVIIQSSIWTIRVTGEQINHRQAVGLRDSTSLCKNAGPASDRCVLCASTKSHGHYSSTRKIRSNVYSSRVCPWSPATLFIHFGHLDGPLSIIKHDYLCDFYFPLYLFGNHFVRFSALNSVMIQVETRQNVNRAAISWQHFEQVRTNT